MMPAVDRTGDIVGDLLVISRQPSKGRRAQWLCRCVCGKQTTVPSSRLHSGTTKSCGCRKLSAIHGAARRGAKTPEYLIWVSMHQRCSNPKNKSWPRYGARGISVCERWSSFDAFSEDMGPRPTPRHSVEREDNDAGYSPSNCRWATATEQASNTRRNVIVEIAGEQMTLKQAVDQYGGRYGSVLQRIHQGMPVEQALGLRNEGAV